MAFPTTSFLDDFDRGDGALGSNWSELGGFARPFTISSSAARVYQSSGGNFEGGSYWNPATFGPDSECYATISALPTDNSASIGIEARIIDAGGSKDGYHLDWTKDNNFALYKITDGVYTMMGAGSTRTMTAGYKFGIEVTGGATTTVKAYTDEGSGWVERLSREDNSSPHTAAGNLSVHFYNGPTAYETTKFDNFGGGTVGGEGLPLTFAWSGKNAIMTVTASGNYLLQTTTGQFTLTGSNAVLTYVRKLLLQTTVGSFIWTPNDARLYRAVKLWTSPGTFTWTRNDGRLFLTRQLRTSSGTFTWTRNNAIELWTHLVKTTPGGFVWTGNNATELWKHLVKTMAGQFIWTGNNAILTRVVLGQYYLYTTTGNFNLTGTEILKVSRLLKNTAGVFSIGSFGEKLLRSYSILSTPGGFVWVGNPATLTWVQALKLLTETGQFAWSGLDAILNIGSAVTIYGSVMARDRNYHTAEISDFLSMTATGSDNGE